MGRAILGVYQEFRLGWARFEMLILHASIDEGRFHQGMLARILDWWEWQEWWHPLPRRLRPLSGDSNTKDSWETVAWFLVGGLARNWVSQLLWLSWVSTRLAADLAANMFPCESYLFGNQNVRISHSVKNHLKPSFSKLCLLEFQIHFLVFRSQGWTLKVYFKTRQFMLILPALKKCTSTSEPCLVSKSVSVARTIFPSFPWLHCLYFLANNI